MTNIRKATYIRKAIQARPLVIYLSRVGVMYCSHFFIFDIFIIFLNALNHLSFLSCNNPVGS